MPGDGTAFGRESAQKAPIPAGTPANIVTRLNSEINAGLTTPEMKAAMKKLDFEPRVGSPEDFARFVLSEIDAWTPAAKAAGILPN